MKGERNRRCFSLLTFDFSLLFDGRWKGKGENAKAQGRKDAMKGGLKGKAVRRAQRRESGHNTAMLMALDHLLKCVDNPEPGRRYEIAFNTAEFTALYARTGQPIFAAIDIVYVPDQRCIEQMSLKQYLGAFRNEKVYCEEAINRMVDDVVAACKPVSLAVTGRFSVRGGISTTVRVCYGSEIK